MGFITNYRNYDVEFEMKDDGKILLREYNNYEEAKKEMKELNYDVCRIRYKYHDHIEVWFGKKLQYVPKEKSQFAELENIKKNLQKLAKHFREWRDINENKNYKAEYPKGIMASSQMKLRTASINCGGNLELRDMIFNSQEFADFKEQNNIKFAGYETTSFNDYIIRLRY